MAAALNAHLQDHLLRQCIIDTKFMKLARSVLEPAHLSSKIQGDLLKLAYEYFDRYGKAPEEHFHDELVHFLTDKAESVQEQVLLYMEKIQKLSPSNNKYLEDRLNEFVKTRAYERAAIEFVELVEKGKVREAQNMMYAALKTGVQEAEKGLDYFESKGFMDRQFGKHYLMRTGWAALDDLIFGYNRKQLVVFFGKQKGRKSWMLQHTARTALMSGLNVLYVSHELDAEGPDSLEERFDMMNGALHSMTEHPEMIRIPQYSPVGGVTMKEELRPSIYDTQEVVRVRATVARFKGRMIIKKYPMGQCTMQELERYLNYLETFEEFIPDVLVNDYADIMAPTKGFVKKEVRHQLDDLYKCHKGLADERSILVVTASQLNKVALQAERPGPEHFAEDYRKGGHLDKGLCVWSTWPESGQGIWNLHVLLNRQGDTGKGTTIKFLMCDQIGQYALASWIPPENQQLRGSDGKTNNPAKGRSRPTTGSTC